MRKVQFTLHLHPIVLACPEAGGDPLPHAVHSEKRRLLVRGREESRGGVGLVMLRENDFALVAEFLFDQFLHPDFLFDPDRYGLEERLDPGWSVSQVGMQKAVKFQEGLLIESHVIEVLNRHAAIAQTVRDGAFGETGIVLFAGEPFFLGRRDDLAVLHQASGAVVVKRRNPEDIHSGIRGGFGQVRTGIHLLIRRPSNPSERHYASFA